MPPKSRKRSSTPTTDRDPAITRSKLRRVRSAPNSCTMRNMFDLSREVFDPDSESDFQLEREDIILIEQQISVENSELKDSEDNQKNIRNLAERNSTIRHDDQNIRGGADINSRDHFWRAREPQSDEEETPFWVKTLIEAQQKALTESTAQIEQLREEVRSLKKERSLRSRFTMEKKG